MNDLKEWDKFYTDMEKGLTNYTRPKDWKERAMRLLEKPWKPVRNQVEGKSSFFHGEDY